MKKITLILAFFSIGILTNAQIVNIPDVNFKTYLLAQDSINTNGDTEIQIVEAINFNGTINVDGQNISNITGIEAFTSLTQLWCSSNQIYTLDLSANISLTTLKCESNQLGSLNVSSNINLEILDCRQNQLDSLDISNNVALIDLDCEFNQLTNLDISNNLGLVLLSCSGNELTSLDISNNLNLVSLTCMNNQLSTLDASNNPVLEFLICQDNQLVTLNANINSIGLLNCRSNNLQSLDLSNASHLVFLYCDNNELSVLEIDDQAVYLATVYCHENLIETIDVSNNTLLTTLRCDKNLLTNLNVSSNIELFDLQIGHGPGETNMLETLNISNNILLETLYIGGMTTLTEVCVWSETFPPSTITEFDTVGSPNIFFTTNCGTNISEFNSGSLTIFPNPFYESISIVLSDQSGKGDIDIKLYDIYGRQQKILVQHFYNEIKINALNLSSGIYLIKVYDKNNLVGKSKIIKQ